MQARTLPSGLKVVVDPSHAAKVVAAQVWVRVGSADELPEEAGLAHVHEHMLFKGTARRKVGEIAADVEGAGGDINAYTSFDQTVYHVTIASDEVETALDILADAVQHSAFEADELAKELEVVLEELRRGQDSPARVSSELLFSEVFKTHNYGRPIIGYVKTVEAFTRDRILDFYKKWYRPENMLLVVAGDVDGDEVMRTAERLFPNSEAAPAPQRPRSAEPAQTELRYGERRMDISETYLSIAWRGPELAHEDTPALDVLSILLGTGESSRLYRRVRRDLELVTDCYAYAYTPQDPGLIGIGAQLQDTPVRSAIEALLLETLRFRYSAPSSAEVEKAKTIVLSEAIYSMQTVQGRARKLGYFELLAGGLDFEKRYRDAVAAVTAEDVQRVAKRWLSEEFLTVVTVRPQRDEAVLDVDGVKEILTKVKTDLAAEYAVANIESLDRGVVRAKLKNGANVLVQPDSAVPIVSILAVAQGGLLDERPNRAGVSHLVGELLVRGTKRYSAEQISETCDAMAGGVAGQSGRNSLGLRGEFLKESWAIGFDIFSSCLLEPSFIPEEVERERRSALEDLAARDDNPGAVAFDAFAASLYGEHPYSWPIVGTRDSLLALDHADIMDAYRSQLRPDKLTITVVGDVSVEETIAQLDRTIGRAEPHPEARVFQLPSTPHALTASLNREIIRDKAQAQLVFGFPGLEMNDERRFALEVMTQVLGGQSGRLFIELRDRQSLAYSVGCFSVEGLAPGYLALHIGTHPSKVAVAEAGMRAELTRICDELVSDEDLARVKRYLVGSYEIALQRVGSRANTMALNEAYGLGYDAHHLHSDRIRAVEAKAVRQIARDLIDFDRMARVVVCPSPSEERSSDAVVA